MCHRYNLKLIGTNYPWETESKEFIQIDNVLAKILQETQYIVFRHKNKKLVTVGALLVPDDARRKIKVGNVEKKRLECKNRKLRV